jgi:hypothetical protein
MSYGIDGFQRYTFNQKRFKQGSETGNLHRPSEAACVGPRPDGDLGHAVADAASLAAVTDSQVLGPC